MIENLKTHEINSRLIEVTKVNAIQLRKCIIITAIAAIAIINTFIIRLTTGYRYYIMYLFL